MSFGRIGAVGRDPLRCNLYLPEPNSSFWISLNTAVSFIRKGTKERFRDKKLWIKRIALIVLAFPLRSFNPPVKSYGSSWSIPSFASVYFRQWEKTLYSFSPVSPRNQTYHFISKSCCVEWKWSSRADGVSRWVPCYVDDGNEKVKRTNWFLLSLIIRLFSSKQTHMEIQRGEKKENNQNLAPRRLDSVCFVANSSRCFDDSCDYEHWPNLF